MNTYHYHLVANGNSYGNWLASSENKSFTDFLNAVMLLHSREDSKIYI